MHTFRHLASNSSCSLAEAVDLPLDGWPLTTIKAMQQHDVACVSASCCTLSLRCITKYHFHMTRAAQLLPHGRTYMLEVDGYYGAVPSMLLCFQIALFAQILCHRT